jgi:adenylate cyclase
MKLVAKSRERTLKQFELAAGADVVLGASSGVDCAVSGEPYLSRMHARIRSKDDRLEVERLPGARNPIMFKGSTTDRFEMRPGDFFVIGSTMFQLQSDADDSLMEPGVVLSKEAEPVYRFTVPTDELRSRGGRQDRLRLIDLMELPEVLRTKTRTDFYVYACGLLRMATGAQWVRVVTSANGEQTVLAEDASIDRATAKPISQALVNTAITEAPKPVTYCWSHPIDKSFQATAHEGIDWAICCAMPVPGEAPILIYLAGAADATGGFLGLDTHSGAKTFLRDTARLVGLVADMIGRAMSLQKEETWKSRLQRFFSPRLVGQILGSQTTDELAPKITEATIMFFDIRGFSERTEGNLDRILEYEGELRRVLTGMTECIHLGDGVVLRYMGDGILACWNVPAPLENHVERACLAALNMVHEMYLLTATWKCKGPPCGIGLGVGNVVAGSLGSEQIYAYDVLGAVANQTARVEGITKMVGVPILVTADVARRLNTEEILTRRVARFRPMGMDVALDLFTIDRGPNDPAQRSALENRLAVHDRGLSVFEAGDWEQAFNILHAIVQDDAAARFVYKLALQGKPPRDWDGIVELSAK